ncbi:helix-turn-helix domain-containing protein [Isoalcanivorax indicus]|uniref:helix-turn-helix domain-containing protein n=1 Tax=Isoalcanivorax indicus TaxID=2202653 RepID=UPI001FE4C443|nr:helix-turn-helix transcriptional regulator [Isoalcanivorax indicus]
MTKTPKPAPTDLHIGHILKERREARKETLEDVAFTAGTDASNLSRIERGLQKPSVACLGNLAAALETQVSSLYLELESRRPPGKNRAMRAPDWHNDLMRLKPHFSELSEAQRAILIDMAMMLKRHKK